ncbi:TetR/AcrR family transcriptional regulator [Micromonospora sp. WMMD812]|uniref:TetR/AcrR family transcriptional regulator n=1 Tax=Micromonospora sp. WMMD812 TaxID=3015152 RepID=UPI00248D1B52|nr:TetR/AcrR family transcriptional regulator [Micromonospora sp. WMMD812]WBB69777.1 TetR/AcrR family transcriptional regulator [Micromonospora sp. WMMD812]
MEPTAEETPALPPVVEAAWGLRERAPKGPRPGLTLPGIVAAAIAVADGEGLAAVSMSRVAKELGAATMALYRYVGAKDELLTLMVDAAYGESPGLSGRGLDWRTALGRWSWAERAALQRHPWVVRVPISGPPLTPCTLGWLEDGLRCLDGTGLTATEKMSVMLLLTGYVRNEVLLMVQVQEGSAASGRTPDEIMSEYARLVARVADPARFPALHEVLASGAIDQDDGPDDEFAFGLERVLDGVEALVSRRPGT